ncbi:MAG: YhjD/YihY/BrkB family envelope integrity protein [Phycisphaeraceae bacterium JB051]
MRIVSQLSTRVRSFIMEPAKESKRTYRYMRFWAMFTWFCTRELKRDNATQMAAALTYRTMFSLLPMLVLALVILQAFRGLENYQARFKQSVITFLLPEELLNRDTSTGEMVIANDDFVGPLTDEQILAQDAAAGESTEQSMAKARALLGDSIEQLLDTLEKVDFGKIGWVGLLVFIYAATTLLETAEKSFNAVFNVEQGRPWYQRLSYYLTMIILGPIFIIIGQVIQQRLMSVIEEGAWTNWLAGPSVVLAPIMTTWIVLLVMFLLLPHAKVQIRAAAIGSFVAAIFWVGSKELFAIYATKTGATSLYGALALVPLFLLWVYLTWLIVLFGLEVAYVLQAMKSQKFQREFTQTRQLEVVHANTLMSMLALIGQAFENGQSVRSEQLVEQLNVSPRLCRQFIQELEKARWIHKVQGHEDGLTGYSLAKPPATILLSDVIKLTDEMGTSPKDQQQLTPGIEHYLSKLSKAQLDQAGSQTLHDVITHAPKENTKDSQ